MSKRFQHTLGVLALLLATPVAVTADDAAQVVHGRQVYEAQRCQICHSIAGVGNRRHPLDGAGSRLSADAIRKWIVAPQEMQPAVRKKAHDDLPAADLEALVAYVLSLQAAPPATQP